jgi:hypothetical protein
MAALVNSTYDLDTSVYDQLTAGLTEPFKAASSLRTHAAYPVEDGGLFATS